MTPFRSRRDHRFHYAASAVAHVEETSCSLGCKRGLVGGRIDPEMPGGQCSVLLDVMTETDEIKELDDQGDRVVCLVREPLVREWTWDGVGDPFSLIIRDLREAAGRVGVGMSQWKGMAWALWIYTSEGLTEVHGGDTVVLDDNGVISVRRAEVDGV